MLRYAASVWRCRYFWLSLVKLDLQRRYRRSLLGVGWSLMHPVAVMVIVCTVFHKVLHADVYEYAPFVLGGLACWNCIANMTLQGCQCFFQGEPYIRQYPAPLAIYPLRVALGATIHFLIALVLVGVLVGYMRGFSNPFCLLSLVPSVILLFLLGWSLALLAGFAAVYFPDTQHLCEVGFQLLFYATPVIYKAELLRENKMAWLLGCNPLVAFLDLIREPLLQGRVPSTATYALAGITVLMALCVAGVSLARLQQRLVFHP